MTERAVDRLQPIAIADDDDCGRNPSAAPSLPEVAAARLGRRALLRGAAALALLTGSGLAAGRAKAQAALSTPAQLSSATAPVPPNLSTLTFTQPAHTITPEDRVAEGYVRQVLIRWGDPVLPGAPVFDPRAQSAEAQALQFGYNNDFVAFLPIAPGRSDRGLLWVNHEYTSSDIMFPNWTRETATAAHTGIEMAAHGASILEVARAQDGSWSVVPDSRYARRIHLGTPVAFAGPAAGHPRLRTSSDPTGLRGLGTVNNCAGGTTPWGTVLTAEENFHMYFTGTLPETHPEAANHKRVGAPGNVYQWGRDVPRFDVGREPNEPNRFGWLVEVDPFDPDFVPVKRTALGRFKHEGAGVTLTADGRAVVYSGDDERFEYLYRFVSAGRYDPADRAANLRLLDEGVLSVARFDGDGTLTWLPLVWGQGPLTPENGFQSQADIVIEARRAADLLGATPMDRPEDVEVHEGLGRIYLALTNNSRRVAEGTAEATPRTTVNPANPRAANAHGHIVEMVPPTLPDGRPDHAAARFDWSIFLLAGRAEDAAQYGPGTDVWLSSPDNLAVSPEGHLWIATDQGERQDKNGIPDGMYACDIEGDGRATVRFFYACPAGAEMCGPAFTPDGQTLFLAVQHPGEGEGRTWDNPASRWPDFVEGLPPRPAIVVVTRAAGGTIGS